MIEKTEITILVNFIDEIYRLLQLIADAESGAKLIRQLSDNGKVALGAIFRKPGLEPTTVLEENALDLIATLKVLPFERYILKLIAQSVVLFETIQFQFELFVGQSL